MTDIPVAIWIVALVILQRLGELVIAKRNTARLMAEGATEIGANHYPVMVALHASWCAALVWVAVSDPAVNWPLIAIFLVLQLGRVWVLTTLGPYWTTRIITVETAELVKKGPFRFVRHPNYLVVALEIPILPLALDAPIVAVIFGLANLAMLAWRIRVEEGALKSRRAL